MNKPIATVSNPNGMDCENEFLKKHNILKLDEFT